MPKRPTLEPILDKQRNRWLVNVPPTLADNGKRTRSYHKSREKARTFIEGLQGKTPAATIPPTLAMEADKAHSLLKSLNVDLVRVAQIYVEAQELLKDTGGTLIDAAKAYRKSWDAKNSSCALNEAITEYLASRADLRDSTLKSYKYSLEKVLAPLHERMMADIKSAELEEILKNKGATARAMHLRNIRTFWRWAGSPIRSWTTMSTVDALEAARVSNDADIEILKPADVKALLEAAEAEGAAAAYAIAVFGGVRMAELERLTWGDVDDEHIEIGKAIAKKHSRRLIPVCPTLKAWLNATRGDAEDDTPIVPPNWIDVSKSVRRRAGWNVAARLLNDQVNVGKLKHLPKLSRGKWPANACRHTCASIQVAIGTPLESLVFAFGHSSGHDLLRRHYVSRLSKKDALKILQVGPNGTTVQLPDPDDGKAKARKTPRRKSSTKPQ
jgi:integrase